MFIIKRIVYFFSLFLLLALILTPVSPACAHPDGHAAPVSPAAPAPLLQFTAGGHVIGFAPTQVVIAALDHALRVEFVGTAGVTPVAVGAEASSDGLTMGPAQPLGIVTYPEVWRGVSIEYRASEGSIVKSTYTVAPGADVAQIRLRYNVPVELQSDGSLQFAFERGYISESAPIAWQEIDGARVPVQVAFRVFETADTNLQSAIENRKSEVGFHLGAYDPRYPLTIDPNYIWHTFYGSSQADEGRGIAVDGAGNVYIAGYSNVTWGTPLNAHSGYYDIVVVKLNSAGGYVWHTFYGSSDWDEGYGIAVDASSNVYVTGYSRAWGTPLHGNSGGADFVVIKLNSAGTYQWHTFYGSYGSGEQGYGIAVDTSSNVYVTGYSTSSWQGDGGANPLNPHSGDRDIVVFKLNSSGNYQWHTFYGSSGWDEGYGIAVDASSNVYVTGYSGNWGSPLNAHSGLKDIVVLKLNSSGNRQWHTFYGSSGDDIGNGIAVDGTGNYVYITGGSGATWGSNPLHAHSGGADIVVLKLTSAGAYQWHTFYGSSNWDNSYGIAVDASSNVYVTSTSAATWQGDGGANPLHAHSGGADIVALKLTSAGAYQWHTFYGLSGEDRGYGIAVASSNVYVTGYSGGTWQGDGNANPLNPFNNSYDIFALKLGGTPSCTATVNGNWNDSAIWDCGRVPGAGENVIIPNNVVVTLVANITIGGNLTITGTLQTSVYDITFNGGKEQNLTLDHPVTFNNLTVSAGTTLIETKSGDHAIVNGTLTNNGVIRKTQAIYFNGTGDYSFGLAGKGNLKINVTTDNFTSITVERRDQNHPGRTGTGAPPASGVGWGIYWTITPDGSGVANLILPHTLGSNHANAKACRFISGTTWDCDRTSSDEGTVTRNGVSAFSDWAVGNNVGPTAVRLTSFQASSPPSPLVLLLPVALWIAAWFTKERLAKP